MTVFPDDSGRWEEGTLESGSDDNSPTSAGQSGTSVTSGEPTTFEPEEDPEA